MRREAFTQERFDRAVALIYDAALDPARMPSAIEAMSRATGAVGGLLGIYDICTGEGHAPWIHGLDPQLLTLFEQHYVLNPWTELVRRKAVVGQVLPSEPFIDAHALRRTAFHRDILAPQRIVGQSFNLLRGDGRFTVGLSLMYTEPGLGTRPQVLRIHRQLGEHVDRAFELMRRLNSLRERLDTAESALDRHRCAVFVLDGRRSIRFANAQARCLLAEGDALVGLGPGLTARHNGDAARLAGLVAAAAAGKSGTTRNAGSMALHRGPGRLPLLAVALPATASRRLGDMPGEVSERGALLFVADPAEHCGAGGELLREAFGLTERELAVAMAVLRMGGLPAAASELCIAPTTARSHLQHVFDKTGARNQVALAQVFAALGVLPESGSGD